MKLVAAEFKRESGRTTDRISTFRSCFREDSRLPFAIRRRLGISSITYFYAIGCAAHSLDRRHLHRHDCHHQTQIEGARSVATQSHQDPCHPLSHPTN